MAAAQFPSGAEDFNSEAVAFVAKQLRVTVAEFDHYEWAGRSGRRHRAEVRAFLGFRECSAADFERLAGWLPREVGLAERDSERVRGELSRRFLAESIEPPSAKQIDQLVRAALYQSELR